MKKIILFILFLYVLANATTITLTQQLYYNVKKGENKNISINNAKANLKNLLLEDAINLIISKKNREETALTDDEKELIRETIKEFQIIKEGWEGDQYYIEAKINIDMEKFDKLTISKAEKEEIADTSDPDAVLARIREIREKADKTRQELAEMELEKKYVSSENLRLSAENFRQGRIAQTLRQQETSIYYYKKAIEYNPYFDNAYFNLGIAYAKTGDNFKSIKIYKEAIKNNDKNAKYHYNLGIVYDNINNYDKACKCYEKAVELNPDYVQAYYNLGSSYLADGKYGKAISSFEKVLEFNPDFTDVYYNIAYAYDEKKDYDNAIIYYKKAIDINEKFVSAIINLGFAYYNNKDYKSAILSYKLALKHDDKDPDIYLKLGVAYKELDFKNEMIEAYQNAASLGDRKAQKYLNKEGISW